MTEEAVPDENKLSIRVVDQNGGEVFFKIRDTLPLSRLMKAYAERKGLGLTSIRFLFDGTRVNDDATPKSLGMENDDVIDVVLQQTGG